MYKHVPVPIDATPLAVATLEQAVAFAKAGGVRLTFLHIRNQITKSRLRNP